MCTAMVRLAVQESGMKPHMFNHATTSFNVHTKAKKSVEKGQTLFRAGARESLGMRLGVTARQYGTTTIHHNFTV